MEVRWAVAVVLGIGNRKGEGMSGMGPERGEFGACCSSGPGLGSWISEGLLGSAPRLSASLGRKSSRRYKSRDWCSDHDRN